MKGVFAEHFDFCRASDIHTAIVSHNRAVCLPRIAREMRSGLSHFRAAQAAKISNPLACLGV